MTLSPHEILPQAQQPLRCNALITVFVHLMDVGKDHEGVGRDGDYGVDWGERLTQDLHADIGL